MVHMTAAAISEVVSCIVRVPTEVIKQRRQACIHDGSSLWILKSVLRNEGPLGLYKGFWTTVLRDAPYSVIQFPLWEYFKMNFRKMRNGQEPTPSEGALSGAVAGAIAGAATTPLDVVKTRIMLSTGATDATRRPKVKMVPIIAQIYKDHGVMGFFAGFVPRVIWIFLGGGIFFGAYEKACVLIDGDS
ncbi:S-adenosylmethionine mitochondrial carrier protein homolog [Halyomorpha halys]|uniref:S-adenosylmethionine mitochondrial carrier protein homolog n=1 Tax=Halyomorpha halys TaxID=286706 RepID=UPI0006D4CECF|nr:S-adenosylmethionine mitochondrial carrier protein homolog [Halyomorpha halys]